MEDAMSRSDDLLTLGVEEEYQVVDPQSRELSSNARSIIQAEATPGDGQDPIQPELHLCQVEIATAVCHTLADVRKELSESRGQVIAAARERMAVRLWRQGRIRFLAGATRRCRRRIAITSWRIR